MCVIGSTYSVIKELIFRVRSVLSKKVEICVVITQVNPDSTISELGDLGDHLNWEGC